MEYTIQKTKENNNVKLAIANERINQLIKQLKHQADNEKVISNEIVAKEATIQFISDIQTALDTYVSSFTVTEDVTYTDEQIDELVVKYQTAKARVDELMADPEINDIENVGEFIMLKEKMDKLKELRTALINAGWTPTQ